MLKMDCKLQSNHNLNNAKSTKRLHIIGRKNSGKTTLIVELIRELTGRGCRVGTIKHTHHHHELDSPGKDSHRHREAGSSAVGILSPKMNAIFWLPENSPDSATNRYQQFESLMGQCDIVLVEGDSQVDAYKIEVYRAVAEEPPLAATDLGISAVVTNDPLDLKNVPIWRRDDLKKIADEIETLLSTNPLVFQI